MTYNNIKSWKQYINTHMTNASVMHESDDGNISVMAGINVIAEWDGNSGNIYERRQKDRLWDNLIRSGSAIK